MSDFFNVAADNMILAVGISFAGGVMTSLTPCVYPVILITVAVFGARQAGSRLQAFLLSLTFASAIILMYTSLGIVSALTGTLFGKLYTNRWFIVSVAGLFVLMGLSLFGLFTIQLPQSLRNRFASAGKAGFAGAFVIGLVSGLLAAPCTGPVLIGILTFVSTTRSVGFGALLLLAYSLGLTLIFIIVGTFVMSLPKSGKWLDAVKDILGVCMMVLAIYFLRVVLPLDRLGAAAAGSLLPVGLAAAAAGLLLVILSHTLVHGKLVGDGVGTPGRRASFQVIRILAIVFFVSGASAAVLSRSAPASSLEWIMDDEAAAMAAAGQEKKPLVVDFTASWCESCLKIERETFSDGQVAMEMERFVLLRMDLSDMTDEDDAVQKKFKIGGLPTVLVIGSDGREASRITEFMDAKAFLEVLRAVR
jgi:thiol:disulfide interchange protein DsbD